MDVALPPKPSRWLQNAYLQTVLSSLRTPARLPREVVREAFEVALRASDDRLLAQGYWQPRSAPALVVLHGVSGSSTASYVHQAVVAGLAAGLHVVALNLRGAGPGGPLATKMYHAGLISDVQDALRAVQGRARVTAMGLLGFSLGGSVALKLAAQPLGSLEGGLRALATISTPFALYETCRIFDATPYWPFRHHILAGLTRSLQGLAPGARLPVPIERVRRLRSLQAFDEEVTAPMHGFAGARDYYDQASCAGDLPRVQLPTLSVHAMDDNVVPLRTLQAARAQASAQVRFVWPKHGGHVGFVTRFGELRRSWAVEASVQFLRRHTLAQRVG